MQQLRERRLTDTPWDVAQVPCNCGLSLNSPERVRDSVAGLTSRPVLPPYGLVWSEEEAEVPVDVIIVPLIAEVVVAAGQEWHT
jgi:hypothetical protein